MKNADDPDCDAPGILLLQGRELGAVPGYLTSSVPGALVTWRHAETLCHLNLAFNKLGGLGDLGALPNLQVLDVSHNALGSLAGVETCANVRCLLAHANAIGKAQGASRREPDSRRGDAPALAPLGGLAKLEELWLSHNELAKPSELLRLGPLGPSLKVLRLRPNACCEASVIDRYRALLCGLLPRLRHLDDEAVTAAERSDGDAYVVSTDGRVAVHKLKAEGREIDATHAKATAVARKQEAKIVPRAQLPSHLRGSFVATDGPMARERHRRDDAAERAGGAPKQPRRRRPPDDAAPLASARSSRSEGARGSLERPPEPRPLERDAHASLSLADAVAALDGPTSDMKSSLAASRRPAAKRPPRRRQSEGSLPPTAGSERPAAAAPREPWPPAPATFEALFHRYAGAKSGDTGAVAVAAPGGSDGSVVVRWPKGGVAVAADGGCVRAFYESGALAAVSDARGAVSVSAPGGATLLSLRAEGGGFSSTDGGGIDRQWSGGGDAPGLLLIDLPAADKGKPAKGKPGAKRAASLGVAVDTKAHFARVYFCHRGVKCCASQHGGVALLPPDSDLYGREKTREMKRAEEDRRAREAAKAMKAHEDALGDLGDEGPAASHADLLSRIRAATEGLSKLTEGLPEYT